MDVFFTTHGFTKTNVFCILLLLVIFAWRVTKIQESQITMIVGNNVESGLTDPEVFQNELEIERSFTQRRELLQKSCRYLNKILGVWISGSITDLIDFHGLLFNSTISDNVIEDFLSPLEALQIENVMDRVKTNLVRWVTSERIGKNLLNRNF